MQAPYWGFLLTPVSDTGVQVGREAHRLWNGLYAHFLFSQSENLETGEAV